MLSEDVLLNIFRHCLADTPRIWPILTWVCQGWRQIIFTSPLSLNLRLHCTYGTPVLKTLDCWPALPISVQYGGTSDLVPPSPDDDDNIIAALQQSGRVSSISLTITSSLHEKLSAISETLSELEELVLLSQDNVQRTLPSTFLWGPRLRTLHSTGIAFPSLPPPLLPCQDLVDIQLHEIPSAGYFSPEAFANALSGTNQVRSLSLHFLSLPPRRNFIYFPPALGERIVLTALTILEYRGTSKYLDSFVARIEAPRLRDIEITLFSQPTMDASQLGRFIERTEIHTSLIQADVVTSAHAVSISFADLNTSTPPSLRLQISCKQLDWQLSCMAQVCDQFSPFLSLVEELSINTSQSSSGQDGVDGEQWRDLIRSFGGARGLRISENFTADILGGLSRANGENIVVLPALQHLHVENPMVINKPSWDALQSFITSRSLSNRPVETNVAPYQCHICHANFLEQQGLKHHVQDQHPYRTPGLCLYCDDFKCKFEQAILFRDHLKDKHPEVARNDSDVRISSRVMLSPQLSRLVERHSSLRSLKITTPFIAPKPSPVAINFPRSTVFRARWASD